MQLKMKKKNNINYFVEYWDCGDDERNKEVISTINANIDSNLFDNIFIFSSTEQSLFKIKTIQSQRITYQSIFNNSLDGINVLSNSDILFDDTIHLIQNMNDVDFFALTRYESNGLLHKYNDPYQGSDSQDVWVWKGKSKITDANFYLGVPGCDNKIAYIAYTSGYNVTNPSRSIKTHHKHKTEIRKGTSSDIVYRLNPPYKLVPVGDLL